MWHVFLLLSCDVTFCFWIYSTSETRVLPPPNRPHPRGTFTKQERGVERFFFLNLGRIRMNSLCKRLCHESVVTLWSRSFSYGESLRIPLLEGTPSLVGVFQLPRMRAWDKKCLQNRLSPLSVCSCLVCIAHWFVAVCVCGGWGGGECVAYDQRRGASHPDNLNCLQGKLFDEQPLLTFDQASVICIIDGLGHWSTVVLVMTDLSSLNPARSARCDGVEW